MSALLEFRGAAATGCQGSRSHTPDPLRYVWHHIQPQEAGGQTVAGNLAELCDSCHYSVHRLLYHLAQDYLSRQAGGPAVPLGPVPRRDQLALALKGFQACAAAGTVDKIPNEG